MLLMYSTGASAIRFSHNDHNQTGLCMTAAVWPCDNRCM
jgi:hypothetical protein